MFHLLPNLFSPITVFSKTLPNFYPSVISLSSTELHQIYLISGDLPILGSQNGAEQDMDFFLIKLILYNVSSYSSVCQHCSIQCSYAVLNRCCKAGEGRAKACVFIGQIQIPSLPHAFPKTYATDLYLPSTHKLLLLPQQK